MSKKYLGITLALIAVLLIAGFAFFTAFSQGEKGKSETLNFVPSGMTERAILAGGCFWCVEADFEKLPGVLDVVSGYTGGEGENPNYKDYAQRGFREVVEVTYDPLALSYATLVEYLIRHSDPTDGEGSFGDRGTEYAPAVYYATPAEKEAAEAVIRSVDSRKVFERPLALLVLPATPFWPAEEYHQDYSQKNPVRYNFYRSRSGRDDFVQKHWGENHFPTALQTETTESRERGYWKNYVKPGEAQLRQILSPLQYKVTQEDGTEKPFENEYDKNEAEGLYVDLLSGEPLYSSLDKFDSGTGWPSFVKPLTPESVVEKEDKGFFTTRTEIRSRYSDSHLGHVFDDGPTDRGGKRYCMNSAALRFVPKEDLEQEGYGEFLALFQ